MATPLLSPTVPDEILVQIVTALDPNNDRQCLVHLMATSSTLWEIAARHLYRSLSVDNKQLEQFVKAGRNLSSRLPRALTFVHRMRITPQLNKTTIHRLWDAAAGASDALFPNVRQLLYVDGLDGVTSYNTFRELRDMHLQHKLPGGILIFERVDVCFTGSGYLQLFLLPIRTIRSITCHGSRATSLSNWGIPSVVAGLVPHI